MGPSARCVDVAAHRHFPSPARPDKMFFVMVRARDVDSGSLRKTYVVSLTVRINFGVSTDCFVDGEEGNRVIQASPAE